MLHPTLETLLFLKIARNTVCENINDSDIEEKTELKNYIQNEASDYEIMHLITLDEMPEVKFDNDNEEAVWEMFRRGIVENIDAISEDCRQEDINAMIFEMGPIAVQGLSSAAPIFEFAKANGQLTHEALTEATLAQTTWAKKHKVDNGSSKAQAMTADRAKAFSKKGKADWSKTPQGKLATLNKRDAAETSSFNAKKKHQATTNTGAASVLNKADKVAKNAKNMKIAGYAGAGALAAAGAYGAYKLYQKWKAKRATAKTEEAKAEATAKMKAAKSKMKKK